MTAINIAATKVAVTKTADGIPKQHATAAGGMCRAQCEQKQQSSRWQHTCFSCDSAPKKIDRYDTP